MDAPTITIRQAHDIRQVYDLRGSVATYRWRQVAVAAAYKMFQNVQGIIVVCDSNGIVLETIDLRGHDRYHR